MRTISKKIRRKFNRIKMNVRDAEFEFNGIVNFVRRRFAGATKPFKWIVDQFTRNKKGELVFKKTVVMKEKTIARLCVQWKAANKQTLPPQKIDQPKPLQESIQQLAERVFGLGPNVIPVNFRAGAAA